MFNRDFLINYIQLAPLPLALERDAECKIFSTQTIKSPILDIGCGEGIFAKMLFRSKVDTGIDPNAKEISRAKQYDAYKEIIQCTGDDIPKKSDSYLTIFSNSVLEHIKEIDKVLAECHRLLKKEGKLFITVPTNFFERYTILYQFLNSIGCKNFALRFANFFNSFWVHHHCYPIQDWKELFKKNGFVIEQTVEYGSKSFCMLNTFLTPLSLLSFFTKKVTNQWVLFPRINYIFATLASKVYGVFEHNFKLKDDKKGGLVFFRLRKNDC